jgi:uncharacterized protein (DUF2252 family)
MVWGVNDFDEVANMPYAVDLVRLVTSAPDWLLEAARAMSKATEQDWEIFRNSQLARRS